jgi:hypothetical protein
MKNLLSWTVAAALILSLPSMAMARGRHHKVSGEVTAVKSTTITIAENTREGKETVTLFVPKGTLIDGKTESDASALSGLVGKHVTVKESSPGTASEIHTKGHKSAKTTTSA